MQTLLTERFLKTLRTIDQLNCDGWAEIDGFDPEPCVQSGCMTRHRKGYWLTPKGKRILAGAADELRFTQPWLSDEMIGPFPLCIGNAAGSAMQLRGALRAG